MGLDPVNEGSKELFDHPGRSLLDGLSDLGGHGREVVASGKGRGGGSDLGGEVVAVVEQLLASAGQFLDTLAAAGGGEVAGLEGAQVAVEGAGGVAQLGVMAASLSAGRFDHGQPARG